MEKVKVGNKLYGYNITPLAGRIYAEVYYVIDSDNLPIQIHVINKSFGVFWREPNESDYAKAREWGIEQIRLIQWANR